MKTLIKILGLLVLSALFTLNTNAAQSKEIKKVTEIDPKSGLIVAKGMEDVIANCTACHSTKFIINQKGSRETWKDMIVWMQETQGLWEFDPATEKSILDYLATNYAPDNKIERRKILPPSALPKNPYK